MKIVFGDNDAAVENLGKVQMMMLGKLGETMASVDNLNNWITYIRKMDTRIGQLEKELADLKAEREKQVKAERKSSICGHEAYD